MAENMRRWTSLCSGSLPNNLGSMAEDAVPLHSAYVDTALFFPAIGGRKL